jgi:hypothetical protein
MLYQRYQTSGPPVHFTRALQWHSYCRTWSGSVTKVYFKELKGFSPWQLKIRGSSYPWMVIRNIFQHTDHNERKFKFNDYISVFILKCLTVNKTQPVYCLKRNAALLKFSKYSFGPLATVDPCAKQF